MNEDDADRNANGDLERLQQQQQLNEASQDAATAQEDVDTATDPDQLGGSGESRDGDAQQQQQVQQLQRQQEVGEEDEQRQQANEEETGGESELQNSSDSEQITQQTADENAERRSLQQTDAERLETTPSQQTADNNSQKPNSQDASPTERRSLGGSGRSPPIQMKSSTSPEKKQQQVAVVHAHERTYTRPPEDPALSRIRRDEERMYSSMSRQATMESHLSIESTSSAQLSQASAVWRNEQSSSQASTTTRAPAGPAQDVSLQAQYEQLRNQLQQQLELQRSQLEREYQVREEQMKQQMMMQWQYFTQQQQHHNFSDMRQDTHRDSDPHGTTTRLDARTNVVIDGTADRQQQRCGCDEIVVQSTDERAHAQPGNAACHHKASRPPVVVDVISRTRDRGGGRRGGCTPAGAHCRIKLGERRTTTSQDELSDDVESSLEVTSKAAGRMMTSGVEWRVCPTCGLCRHPCDTTSDGKTTALSRSQSLTPTTIYELHHAASLSH